MAESGSVLQRSMVCTAFLEGHVLTRKDNREKSKSISKHLLTAHQFAFSAIISYVTRIQGMKFAPQSKSVDGSMALIAQFIQGIDLAETAICEALYPQAANLLKQELETIAALDEFEAGNRREKKTPQMSGKLANFGRRYGELNNLAHPSRQEIVERLSSFADGERYGPTTIPQFNSDLFKDLYGLQATLMIMLLPRMRHVFVAVFEADWDDEEARLATSALGVLEKEGVVQVLPDTSQPDQGAQ